MQDDPITVTSGPVLRRWRRAAWLSPVAVLGTGGFAVWYPSFSRFWLGVLLSCMLGLFAWSLWLSTDGRYLRPWRRLMFAIAFMEVFALFGCITAWRVQGEGLGPGLAIAVLFGVCVGAGFLFRRPLYPILASGGRTPLSTGATVALAMGAVVAVRVAPVWFAQHLLLPVMLLVATIIPPYWAGVEKLD